MKSQLEWLRKARKNWMTLVNGFNTDSAFTDEEIEALEKVRELLRRFDSVENSYLKILEADFIPGEELEKVKRFLRYYKTEFNKEKVLLIFALNETRRICISEK